MKLQGDLLMQKRQYAKATEVFAAMAGQAGPDEAGALEDHASALEADGRPAEALEVYRKAWAATKSVFAANNASCIITNMFAGDKAKLADANQWMTEALKASSEPVLIETAGWLAHVQGRSSDALVMLRRAIKGMPDSPEAHYHLGMAETAAGDADLGRLHLAAAVDLGNDLKAAGRPIPKTTAEAVELARQALNAESKQQRIN
jgi:tetratricopeptide (TPR) repeat protein